jgi:tetratricopeptide (TPR) repeat protein
LFLTWNSELGTRNCLASAGEEGFQFLKLGASPRSAALGGTGVCAESGEEALSLNPAGLGELRWKEASFSYGDQMESMNQGALTLAGNTKRGGIGVQAQSLQFGTIPGTDLSGNPTSAFSANDLSLAVGIGRRIWEDHASWGASVKQVSETIDGIKGTAYALDLGVVREWKAASLRAGLDARNLGSGAKFDEEKTSLPQSFDAGVSWKGFSEAVTAAVEVHKTGENTTFLSGGIEAWLQNALAFRAGYRTDGDVGRRFSLGLGFRLRDIRVDYAFADAGSFGGTHRVGIQWRFGNEAQSLYEEGAALSQKGLYPEAILKFKEALDLDPNHRAAARGLRDAVQRLNGEMRGS